MQNEDNITERLWQYIDGNSSPDEKTAIEKLLQENNTWQENYQALLQVQELLQQSDLHAPSLRFTKNVMESIAHQSIAPATKNYINYNIVKGLAAVFIGIVTVFVIYAFFQVKFDFAPADDKTFIPKHDFDYSVIFNNDWVNVILLLNMILGLFLLDQFLTSKKRKFQQRRH
jgi:hypothetical protein